MKNKPSVVFMGTPEFAVPSLRRILEEGYPVVGVVTAPDRPAGRGRRLQASPVKIFAEEAGLQVLQPENLKSGSFLGELELLSPDIIVVVAFRMLPKAVWEMPRLATFNLHASLLPQYRGAAPINWAIINGEKETGLTTFLIDDKIDTGHILLQEKMSIGDDEDAGSLHDRMMVRGGELVVKTIRILENGDFKALPQDDLAAPDPLKPAPKLNRDMARIDWNKPATLVRNRIRGLSPYPGAYSFLISPAGERSMVKIFEGDIKEDIGEHRPGEIRTGGGQFLAVACSDKWLNIRSLQIEGKRRMNTGEFLRGADVDPRWKMGN